MTILAYALMALSYALAAAFVILAARGFVALSVRIHATQHARLQQRRRTEIHRVGRPTHNPRERSMTGMGGELCGMRGSL